jgi:signal peptidase I
VAQPDITTRVPPRDPARRRSGPIVFALLAGLAAAALITSVAIPVLTIQPYLEQSTSMQPTLVPGDRLFAVPGAGVRRGDVIVVRVPTRVARVPAADDLFVKRLIGLPGDHVACCDAKGRITVNGKPLDETYLYPGDPPSRVRFSVTLGKGQIWVMGDHRNISIDSRQWGAIPASGIVGRVAFVAHGSSFTALRTPQAFVAAALAPRDTRPDFYLRLALVAVASAAALLILAIVGITRIVIRMRRRSSAPPGLPGGLGGPEAGGAGVGGGVPAPPGPPGRPLEARALPPAAAAPDPEHRHADGHEADRGHRQAHLGSRGLLERTLAQPAQVAGRADPVRQSVDGLRQALPCPLYLGDDGVRVGPVHGTARGGRAVQFDSAVRIGHRKRPFLCRRPWAGHAR